MAYDLYLNIFLKLSGTMGILVNVNIIITGIQTIIIEIFLI